jgi:hypothetical protein
MDKTAQVSYEIGEDVLFQAVDNEAVLLDLTSQQYYGLNSVATRIWQLLLDGDSTMVMADRICAEYDIDRHRVLLDIESLTRDLSAAGLLRIRGVLDCE